MTTLLLRASRVLELPGQKNKRKERVQPARKSIVDILRAATSRKKSGLRKANLEEIEAKRHFSASDIDFAQYQQNRTLL